MFVRRPPTLRQLSLALIFLVGVFNQGIAQKWAFGPTLSSPRFTAECALLQNGNVLIMGGTPDNVSELASCEIFDLSARTIRPSAAMKNQRTWTTSVLLHDGRLLVIGGYNNRTTLTSCELYDPINDVWTPTGSLKVGRLRHSASLLPDGRVLVAGGTTSRNGSLVVTSSCEIYDPSTGQWENTQSLPWERASQSMIALPSGKILLVGGYPYAVECALFDPTTFQWRRTGSPTTAFPTGENSLTLLPDGTVLLAGGWGGSMGMSAVCEIYDPTMEKWSRTGDLKNRRAGHRTFLLPNGKVLIAGGHDAHVQGNDQTCFSLSTCEIYDPSTKEWTYTTSLPEKPSYFGAALLPTGEIFIAGGGERDDNATPKIFFNTTLLFTPGVGEWNPGGSTTGVHGFSTLSALPNGKAILIGGAIDCANSVQTNATELYDFASRTWATGANLLIGRDHQTATLLTTDKLLIVGGQTGRVSTSTCEFFDYTNNTCTAAPDLALARAMHTATLLADGRLLIVGGATGDLTDQQSLDLPRKTELFSSFSNRWESSAPLLQGRYGHTATLLEDGRVLVVGGWNHGYLTSCELYDPVCDSWVPAPPIPIGRAFHTATPLTGNKVIITGGQGESGDRNDAVIFDANTNSWQSAGTLAGGRYGHLSVISSDGRIVVVGGRNSSGTTLATAEVYDVIRNSWETIQSIPLSFRDNAACALPDGSILLAGGYSDDAAGCHLEPNALTFSIGPLFAASIRPQINSVTPTSIETGASGTLTTAIAGERFRDDGRSGSDASTGDYSNTATNYPIVSLRRIGTDQLPARYVNFDVGPSVWNSNATTVRIPLGTPGKRILPAGWYSVTLTSNAISSITSYLRIAYTEQEASAVTTISDMVRSCTDFTITATQATCFVRSIELDSANSENVRIEIVPSLPAPQVGVHIKLVDPFRRGSFILRINNSQLIQDSLQGAPQLTVSGGSSSTNSEETAIGLNEGCDSIILHNTTAQPLTLPAGNFLHNTTYSIPATQFPITIKPYDSVTIMVCLSAIVPSIYQDTLVLANNCSPIVIPFKTRAGDSVFLGTDGCGSQIQARYVTDDYLIKVSQPTPNPATGHFSISVHTSEPATGLQRGTSCILYDLLGNAVARATFDPTTIRLVEKKIDNEGQLTFDVSVLPSGSYIATIYSESGTLSFPVHIVH